MNQLFAKFAAFLSVTVLCFAITSASHADFYNDDGVIDFSKRDGSVPSTTGSTVGWGGLFGGSNNRASVRFPKSYRQGTIIVSFGDRRLYHVRNPGRADSYPIAVPKEGKNWSGNFRVTRKVVNPGWTPTPEMRRENPKLPLFVEGGDRLNPLGSRALYVGSTLYRIHGTDAPWLIGKAVSRGCVRMHNKDVNHLYDRTRVGARIIVTYKRFM